MEIRKTLNPGDHGTIRHQARFGEKLVCVRYRYDDNNKQRYTTVELIVDKRPYYHYKAKQNTKPQQIERIKAEVHVKVPFDDLDMRLSVKQAGGKWDKANQTWKISKQAAIDLGLKNQIIKHA